MEIFFSLFYLGVNIWNIFFKSRIISFVTVASLMLIASFSYGISDYTMYEYYYNQSVNYNYDLDTDAAKWYFYSTDLGYTFSNAVSNYFGLDFLEYHVLYILVAFSIIYGVALYLCRWRAFTIFLFLYCIYPFIFDVIQIRNTIVLCFLLLGIIFLINKYKYSDFVYIVFLIIASFFHKIAIILIPFILFYRLYEKNKMMKTICVFFVFVGLMMPLYGEWIKNNLEVFSAYLALQDADTYNNMEWYLNHEVRMKYLAVWGEAVSIAAILHFLNDKIDEHMYNFLDLRTIHISYVFSLYIIALSPLFPVYDDFSRLPRMSACLFYIVCAIYLTRLPFKERTKLWVVMIGWIAVFSYIFFYSILSNELTMFFQANYLFKWGY